VASVRQTADDGSNSLSHFAAPAKKTLSREMFKTDVTEILKFERVSSRVKSVMTALTCVAA
jgi:hypothetical protein